jgi:hypothetical protein
MARALLCAVMLKKSRNISDTAIPPWRSQKYIYIYNKSKNISDTAIPPWRNT